MNDSLEVERYREIEAELHALTSKARVWGSVSGGLLGAAAVFGWLSDGPELLSLRWMSLCLGILFGLHWIALVVEANRAKVELSLHLMKNQFRELFTVQTRF
jgi:hypothetical protein